MPLFSFDGRCPPVSPDAWIAPTATVVGDVTVEAGASVWYGAVVRADFGAIKPRRPRQRRRSWTTPKTMGTRDFALLAKDPDSHAGRVFRVFGEVTQFDAATGDDQFLARSGAKKSAVEYGYTDYEQNTLFTGDRAMLKDIVEGDVFAAVVEVEGSESYETQIGGNTTVPKFRVLRIEVYDSTL